MYVLSGGDEQFCLTVRSSLLITVCTYGRPLGKMCLSEIRKELNMVTTQTM